MGDAAVEVLIWFIGACILVLLVTHADPFSKGLTGVGGMGLNMMTALSGNQLK